MKYVYVEHWTTVAVTALPPGWFNVYRDDDDSEMVEPCPALLLQENREVSHAGEVRNVEKQEPPYDTRVAFGDASGGTVEPACEVSNYLRTEYRGA